MNDEMILLDQVFYLHSKWNFVHSTTCTMDFNLYHNDESLYRRRRRVIAPTITNFTVYSSCAFGYASFYRDYYHFFTIIVRLIRDWFCLFLLQDSDVTIKILSRR